MRWLFVLATFLLSVLLYVDRICISAAKDGIVADLHFTDKQMGWLFSAFSLGYALFQTPSGWLADRLGPRRVLALIVSGWSMFTGLTAVVNQFITMLLVRFSFGAAEAGAFPGMARAVFSWVPMQERGRVQAINFSGSRIGAALALPVIAWMITSWGWRPTFVVLMGLGIVWAIVWFIFFKDDPRQAGWLKESELDHILANRQSASQLTLVADGDHVEQPAALKLLRSMLRSSTLGALCAQYFASNFIFFFALTWFFPVLKQRYNLSGIDASLFAAMPLLCGAMGCWVSGWWVDRLYKLGRWTQSRRWPAMIGFFCATIGILGSAHAETALTSSLWFSLCIFGADMTLPPSWSVCVDIGGAQAGMVSGTMNMAGNLGAFLTSLAFPYMLSWTNSSLPYFYVAGMLNCAAILIWLAVQPTVQLQVAARERVT